MIKPTQMQINASNTSSSCGVCNCIFHNVFPTTSVSSSTQLSTCEVQRNVHLVSYSHIKNYMHHNQPLTNLPWSQTFEEEVEGDTPDHSARHDIEQGLFQNLLTTSQLHKNQQPNTSIEIYSAISRLKHPNWLSWLSRQSLHSKATSRPICF